MGSLLSISYLTTPEEVLESTDEDSYHSQSSTPAECDVITVNKNIDRFQMNLQEKLEANTKGLQTDAVESRQITSDNNQITLEIVRDIESNLNLNEKVSLVFLLYVNEDLALQNLLTEIANNKNNTTINPIYYWAQSKHSPEKPWQKQFLEALCIIENYSVLEKIGYTKNDLKSRFLPVNPNSTVFVNLVRKTLYIMCENFSKSNTVLFLKYLREDFEKKSISWEEYDIAYLELHILHCFSRNYIKEYDLSNFIKIVKRMNLEEVSLWLESSMNVAIRDRHTSLPQKKEETQLQRVEVFKTEVAIVKPTNLLEKPPSCSDHSLIGDQSIITVHSDDEYYKIDPKNVGLCVIFNQKTFYKENDSALQFRVLHDHELEPRYGTEFDRDRLADTFKSLGFRIQIFENKTHAEIELCLSQITETFSTHESCFVVCILSHGVEDCIYGANSVPVRIKDIEDLMHKNITGKPKILIIQSCQGRDLQPIIIDGSSLVTDGKITVEHETPATLNTTASAHSIPEKADFILCSSTIARYASVRDEKKGSWYIQELCDRILEDCNRNHFADILTKVNGAVTCKRWKKDGRYVCMVPEYRTSFGKKLFLPIISPNSEENS